MLRASTGRERVLPWPNSGLLVYNARNPSPSYCELKYWQVTRSTASAHKSIPVLFIKSVTHWPNTRPVRAPAIATRKLFYVLNYSSRRYSLVGLIWMGTSFSSAAPLTHSKWVRWVQHKWQLLGTHNRVRCAQRNVNYSPCECCCWLWKRIEVHASGNQHRK